MRRRPIGQILVEKQEITEEDLAAALAEQDQSGKRLGEILIESGRISWLALARAMAEQVLDIKGAPAEEAAAPEPAPPAQDPVELIKQLAERVANAPMPDDPPPAPAPTPALAPAPQPASERELAQAVAEQVASITGPEAQPTTVWSAKPKSVPQADDPELRLESVESLLRERQRAFIELFTTAETLRMKVTRLEEILEERDRELTRLRVLRAS